MTDQPRYLDVLTQLEASISAPWESLAMTLDMHPFSSMGDPTTEGSAAWHLVHIATVFRNHAKHVVGEEQIEQWSPMPESSIQNLPIIVEALSEDCERFCQWCRSNSAQCNAIDYGGENTFEEMLGIMLRHIIWHAAAVHYWCKWKSDQ